jgi:hypothetical protein
MTKFKEISLILILTFFLLNSCDLNRNNDYGKIEFVPDPRLDIDVNGYYHLELNLNTIQTTHRLSGHIYEDEQPLDIVKFNWESSHYWILEDTLGYVYQDGFTNDFIYTTYDTTYIVGFDGFEVPTINCCSYSNSEGEVNTMFGPTRKMRGDTVRISVGYYHPYKSEFISTEFMVVLD